MEKLFEDKERNGLRYSKNLDKAYKFYDQTTMPQFVEVREMLNEWFSKYPINHRNSLKRDFQSQFDSAFFELFIHELFYQQGFTLTPHPTVPNASKNPDFLAKKGELEIYLEAKVATDKSNDERVLENKRGAIYDTFLDLKTTDFGILIHKISFKTTKQAKLGRLKLHIQKWLDSSHVARHPIYNETDDYGNGCFTYEDFDVKLRLSLLPCKVEEYQPILTYIGGNIMGGCEEALISAVKEKSTKYGVLDKPYIVCVNLIGHRYPYPSEIYNTLFGRRKLTPANISFNSVSYSTELDGILRNSNGPTFTQVSAFLLTTVNASNLHVANHWLIEHPQANLCLNFEAFDLTFNKLNHSEMETVNKKSISQVLRPENH